MSGSCSRPRSPTPAAERARRRRRVRRLRVRPGRRRRSAATHLRGAARALLADASTSPPPGRCCSPWTTCSGATPVSLRFLAYLVRRLEGLPVLIVATLRTGEPHDDDGAARGADRSTRRPCRCGPARSARGASPTSCASRLGAGADAPFVAACHRTTSGNPLLLRQLLRRWRPTASGPDAAHAGTVTAIGSRAVSSMVLMRLRRMPPASAAVARAIAVLGDGAGLPTVAALAGVPRGRAAAGAVAALARAEVLRTSTRSGSCTRSSPTPSTPTCRPASGSCATSGPRGSSPGCRRRAGAGRRAPAAGRPTARRPLGRRRAARRGRTAPCDRGAPDGGGRLPARALDEPPEPAAAARGAAGARAGRDAQRRPGGDRRTCGRPTTRSPIRGHAPPWPGCSSARCLRRARRRRDPVRPAGRRRALPAGTAVARRRQGLLATGRIAGYMHDLDPAVWRRRPEPAVSGDGRGARMLAVALAWEAVMDGTDRAGAVRAGPVRRRRR